MISTTDSDVLCDGLSFKAKHFKSIGASFEGFDCFRRINVIIGRNNSGKSSLVDLIETAMNWGFTTAEDHWHAGESTVFHLSSTITEGLAKRLFSENTRGGSLDHWSNHWGFGRQLVGKTVTWKRGKAKGAFEVDVTGFESSNPFEKIGRDDAIREAKEKIANAVPNPFEAKSIRRLSAERDVLREPDSQSLDVSNSGSGATNIIQNYLNQSKLQRSLVERDLLDALNSIFQPDGEFTRILAQQLGNGGLWEIYLEEESKGRIALSNSGSGLKTILLVLVNLILIPAAQKRDFSSYIFAFEELENNLHPALLRRLLAYVSNAVREKKTLLFLTTHSSAMIDFFSKSKDSQIIHVRHDRKSASVTTVKTYVENRSILDDLDVRASDLLQANCIIWVEGPSDRYYLNRWIALWNDSLIEGTHYQCVFYGGRLLKHLEASPESESSGVQILRLARHACVVIDSDKRRVDDRINATKARVKAEIEGVGGIAWITSGKEIENYIPLAAIEQWQMCEFSVGAEQFESVFDFLERKEPGLGAKHASHKPEFAEEVSQFFTLENCKAILDLDDRMKELCAYIERVNGLSN